MEEYFFCCPYCLQTISFLVDTSVHKQEYVEDCEVCCRPIEVKIQIASDSLQVQSFIAQRLD